MNAHDPARGGTWRTWFLRGTAAFLSLTAAWKLLSVVSEAPVLAARDPLLSWLTQRQVLFGAALMEVGVASVLLRRPAGRQGAWLLLWLVAVFGVYRIGLWAVSFQGHCKCLGPLFDWLPAIAVWGDRIAVALLVGMAAGSTAVLLSRSEHDHACAQSARRAARPVDRTAASET